jgi:hypothetical protein
MRERFVRPTLLELVAIRSMDPTELSRITGLELRTTTRLAAGMPCQRATLHFALRAIESARRSPMAISYTPNSAA